MEKLNEVKQALKYLEIDAKAYADNFSASIIVSTKNILAIAEAFRALEKRAEAAEAKLAELVPDEMTKSLASIANEYQTSPQNALFIVVGWNACRAAILRKIEEQTK